ncbi:hypothetical protein [Pedobacter sp. NJ-S-72]
MKHLFPITFLILLVGITFLFSCTSPSVPKDEYKINLSFKPGEEAKIAEAFLAIKDSTRILLKAGLI